VAAAARASVGPRRAEMAASASDGPCTSLVAWPSATAVQVVGIMMTTAFSFDHCVAAVADLRATKEEHGPSDADRLATATRAWSKLKAVIMPTKPAAPKPPGKQSKAAKKAEELAHKQEEERQAALIEEERLQREQIEREEELKRLAEEKRLVNPPAGFESSSWCREFAKDFVSPVVGSRGKTACRRKTGTRTLVFQPSKASISGTKKITRSK
jgi:hypothetical protein